MAGKTQNYGYPKPEEEDFYDVGDFNRAMDMIDKNMKETEDIASGINKQITTFEEAENRENISENDTLGVILGKIKKNFTDLKKVAFSGSYKDLSDKPSIPAEVKVKGNAETDFHTGNVNISPENIGSPSNEYMEEHFVPDYVSSAISAIGSQGIGWYRIAKAKYPYYNSCVISLKRSYNLPGPEYQKIQLMNAYSNHKFVSLAALSNSHIWSKIRETWDEEKTEAYIEVYLSEVREARDNMWLISIEDAMDPMNSPWKAIPPVKTEETVSGVAILASLDLPANFDSSYLVNKNGDLVNGIIKFIQNGLLQFIAPDGSAARGVEFYNKDQSSMFGGIGVYSKDGNPQMIYMGAGTNAPWNAANGLSITGNAIKWKNSNILTEDSGTAYEAARDDDGNVIKDSYAKKSIYGDTIVSAGRKEGTTVGEGSFAFGNSVIATGKYSHTEGNHTTASGNSSHAEGSHTTASGNYSHTEGNYTTASGNYSHTEGNYTTASNYSSHAEGDHTEANNYASHASGKYNKSMIAGGTYNTQVGDAFVVGNGVGSSARSNALRITNAGEILGTQAFKSSGADYAEHIKPWADGNPDNEDRVGYFVTLKDGALYKANTGDYIAGITSGNPSVVGNADEDYYWKYDRDTFNRIVMEDVPEEIQAVDEDGNPVFDEETHEPIMVKTGNIIKNARMKLSESYDPSLQESYVERKDRKEWDYVGMIGVIPVRDNGTCLPDHFCKCGQDGIATLATERGFDTFYVLERISENVVSVELR